MVAIVEIRPVSPIELGLGLSLAILNIINTIYIFFVLGLQLPIVINIANSDRYCQMLSCIVQYCSSDYFSSLLSEIWYCKEHSDIFQYCQIYPNIVRHWLILFSIDQYCPVTPCVDIFQLKPDLNHFKPDLDAVKYWLYKSMQLCKYAGMQVCNYAIKS